MVQNLFENLKGLFVKLITFYRYEYEDYEQEGSKVPQFIRNIKSCITLEHQTLQYRISAAVYFFMFYLMPSVVCKNLFSLCLFIYLLEFSKKFKRLTKTDVGF